MGKLRPGGHMRPLKAFNPTWTPSAAAAPPICQFLGPIVSHQLKSQPIPGLKVAYCNSFFLFVFLFCHDTHRDKMISLLQTLDYRKKTANTKTTQTDLHLQNGKWPRKAERAPTFSAKGLWWNTEDFHCFTEQVWACQMTLTGPGCRAAGIASHHSKAP